MEKIEKRFPKKKTEDMMLAVQEQVFRKNSIKLSIDK